MKTPPHICVVIPVYNHGLTVGQVARESRRAFPAIVVNDGSTDQTAAVLAQESGLAVITLPENRGKAAALKAGFAEAEALGFTHAITIDADGQHPAAALEQFAASCRNQPDALVIGVRDLKAAGAPLVRRFSNGLSTLWFRFETGVRLADNQCGYRVYPLAAVRDLRVKSERYAFELEVMVKAVWAGMALVSQPVQVDYAAATSQLSHFRLWRDFVGIVAVHSRLCAQAFFLPATGRWSGRSAGR
jgi:glycosyltransferase involved in cell wall biosynthesis